MSSGLPLAPFFRKKEGGGGGAYSYIVQDIESISKN